MESNQEKNDEKLHVSKCIDAILNNISLFIHAAQPGATKVMLYGCN